MSKLLTFGVVGDILILLEKVFLPFLIFLFRLNVLVSLFSGSLFATSPVQVILTISQWLSRLLRHTAFGDLQRAAHNDREITNTHSLKQKLPDRPTGSFLLFVVN